MPDVYNSKVVLADGTVLIDLTADTVDAAHLLSTYTAHKADGSPVTGSCTFDSDTSSDTLQVAEALVGKTFHARGTAYTGTMVNNGAVSGTISDADDVYTVPVGYHDGSGTVTIAASEVAKLKNHANIKNGVTILGETGTYSGEAISVESNKNATPKLTSQVITPSSGYDYLAQVTVAAITVTYSDNAAGGKTVTIGAV